jgi:hypothetical protein
MTVFELRRPILLLVAGLALAGCWQSTPARVDENAVPVPAVYKQEIIELVMKMVDDPTNLRDAGITEPALRQIAGAARYMICVRFNPRNVNHDYTGIVERVGYFYAGKLNQFVKAEPGQCSGAAYRPFPELEKICLGVKC